MMDTRPAYRLFIDESGDSNWKSGNPYLGLTGLIFKLDYHNKDFTQQLEGLKQKHFSCSVPVIFHRDDIIRCKGDFVTLKDDFAKSAFDKDLLAIIMNSQFTVITVVIDKQKLVEKYKEKAYDPYLFALELLLERYYFWLNCRKTNGDVIAEARGKKQDKDLKKAFMEIYEMGTGQINSRDFVGVLSSSQIKFGSKKDNIAGLQMADLIAHPSRIATINEYEGRPFGNDFGGKIIQALNLLNKYHCNDKGIIKGCGRKLFPE